MRRSDKEVTDKLLIKNLLAVAPSIRVGYDNTITPYPLTFSDDTILLEGCRIYDEVTFEAHITCGIKESDKICSYSTRYMSVMGEGIIHDKTLNISTISCKMSTMTETLLPAKKEYIFRKGNVDFSLLDEICLGLNDKGKIYIVPVNHVVDGSAIYIHSAKVGRKVDLLKTADQIIIEGEDYSIRKDIGIFRNMEAIPMIVTGDEERLFAIGLMGEKFAKQDYPFTPEIMSNVEIFKLIL